MRTEALGAGLYLFCLDARFRQTTVFCDVSCVAVHGIHLCEREVRERRITGQHLKNLSHVQGLVGDGRYNAALLLGDKVCTLVVVGHRHDLFEREPVELARLASVSGGEVLELLAVEHSLKLFVELVDGVHRDAFLLELLNSLSRGFELLDKFGIFLAEFRKSLGIVFRHLLAEVSQPLGENLV